MYLIANAWTQLESEITVHCNRIKIKIRPAKQK